MDLYIYYSVISLISIPYVWLCDVKLLTVNDDDESL